MARGALVQDWMAVSGGAEQVFVEMVAALPDTDILTLWSERADPFPGRPWRESWVARTPLRRHKALAVPAMLATWRTLPGAYDWLLVSSHAFAHHARFPASPDARKYVYVHSPPRYVWSPEIDARGQSLPVRVAAAPLRRLDRHRAQAAHSIAANSVFVAERIRRAWGRDSVVINPPVEVTALQEVADWRDRLTADEARTVEALPEAYLLGASRFVPYKALDDVIAAGERTGLPVVIAGGGPQEAMLRARAATAGVPVTFVIRPSDALLRTLLQQATVYVFPPLEDFGILPVEAMALGTPVVGLDAGGTAETVVDGVTGALVTSFEDAAAVREALDVAVRMDPDACRRRSELFSAERFRDRLREWLAPELG